MIYLIGFALYVLLMWIGICSNNNAHSKRRPRADDDLLSPYEKYLEFDLAKRESEWRR